MSDTNPEVRQRIDAHLDAVERQLAGLPRDQRRAIVDDLEAQITDMLGGRTGMATAGPDQVAAVLGRLDAPGTYGVAARPPAAAGPPEPLPVVPRPLCPGAVRGACWLGLGALAGFFFVLAIASNHRLFNHVVQGADRPRPSPWLVVGVPAGLLLAAAAGVGGGTLEGWVALGRIRRSTGGLDGLPLAVFDAVTVPVLLAWLGSIVLWGWIMNDGPLVYPRDLRTERVAAVLTASALTFVLARVAVRYGRPAPAGPSAGVPSNVAAV